MSNWEDQSVIVLWIWLGIAVLILITLFVVLLVMRYMKNLQKNKQKTVQLIRKTQTGYLEKALYIQEMDRQRLAEELHDNVISQLNLIRLNISTADLNDLNQDLKKSMRIIRELTHNLTPPDLDAIGLNGLITDYLEQVAQHIRVAYWDNKIIDTVASNEVKLNLFRIVQELVTNILKHANATKIDVSLRISLKYIILAVADNGCGFITGTANRGIGLKNIEARTKLIQAVYKLKSTAKKGTTFIVCVAVKPKGNG